MERMQYAYYLLMVYEKASGHPQLQDLAKEALTELDHLMRAKDAPKAMPAARFPSLKDNPDGE